MNPTCVTKTSSGKSVYFIHVPRAGGRSVAHWFGLDTYSPNHMANATTAKQFDPNGISFGVVRKPAARAVSEYRFRYPDGRPGDCSDWVMSSESVFTSPYWSAKLMLDGADYLIPFHDLQGSLRLMLSYLGAPQPRARFPHVLDHAERGTEEPRTRPLHEYLSFEAMEFIDRVCSWESTTGLC